MWWCNGGDGRDSSCDTATKKVFTLTWRSTVQCGAARYSTAQRSACIVRPHKKQGRRACAFALLGAGALACMGGNILLDAAPRRTAATRSESPGAGRACLWGAARRGACPWVMASVYRVCLRALRARVCALAVGRRQANVCAAKRSACVRLLWPRARACGHGRVLAYTILWRMGTTRGHSWQLPRYTYTATEYIATDSKPLCPKDFLPAAVYKAYSYRSTVYLCPSRTQSSPRPRRSRGE